ncbi:MAG: transposase [Patescibacteria group bacterium]
MSDIYHTLSRGVDKRKLFLDKQDYLRFIHNLFKLNNQDIVHTTIFAFRNFNKDPNKDIASPNIEPRKLLVDIYVFCLMPNHYHLLLSPRIENGIPRFMKKLNMAYAKYFNTKYKRKGTLFESRYKSILIEKEPHFYHLPYYIHLNPLDIEFPEWREGKLKNYNRAMEFLENYRWSSHLDYIGKKNFPSVTNREFLLDVFEGTNKYAESIKKWLKDLKLEAFKESSLE